MGAKDTSHSPQGRTAREPTISPWAGPGSEPPFIEGSATCPPLSSVLHWLPWQGQWAFPSLTQKPANLPEVTPAARGQAESGARVSPVQSQGLLVLAISFLSSF